MNKKCKRSPDMTVDRLRQSLFELSKQAANLAEHLDAPGDTRSLTKSEEALIKYAHLPMLDELFAEIKLTYLANGELNNITYCLDQIMEVITAI